MISEAKLCKSWTRDDRCPPTQGETKHATQNACKMCAPLGASLAFAGIRGCISILHGSQGCATYIRRYLISHFREPMDIASSSFSEEDAIFGGGRNLKAGIENVSEAYAPRVIGVATTCLAETIGEDVPQILREYRDSKPADEELPFFIQVSTASYSGDHWSGYHKTVRSIVEEIAKKEVVVSETHESSTLLLPGMVSCEDMRHLKGLFDLFGTSVTVAPDYSDTLDGGSWSQYHRIPEGGTSVEDIHAAIGCKEVISLGAQSNKHEGNAGVFLSNHYNCSNYALPLPIGIRATDAFVEQLSENAGIEIPESLVKERARLVDAYVDGHKYLSGKTVVVYADPDLLVGLVSLLSEMGLHVVGAVTGSNVKGLEETIRENITEKAPFPRKIISNADHAVIATLCRDLIPDLMVGNSKGYPISRELDIPLVRCGMPIHDRIGAQRVLHVGYTGAQRLFDHIVNTLLQHRQDENEVGFSYL